MAVLLRGLDRAELSRWTAAMIASGERAGLLRAVPGRPRTSTPPAGSGDKITLPLVPLVATCGVAVPQLSGRGLGHTGGTLDKLESIPGWRAALDRDAMMAQLEDVGAVICAAGSGLAPADAKLYALRDVTGTVESIPLIASSIMSKKIAEGTGALVSRRQGRHRRLHEGSGIGPDSGSDHGRARRGRRTPHRGLSQ